MENVSDEKVFFGGMIILLLVSIFPILLFFHELKKPLLYSKWITNEKKHVVVSAKILESKIIESGIYSYGGNAPNRTFEIRSRYCPLITVSFNYNNQRYTTDLNLNNKGFVSPEEAISALYDVTNGGSFTFIHSFSDSIRYEYTKFLKEFRIPEYKQQISVIPLKIDAKNPLDNEYQYNTFKPKDFLPAIIMLLFSLIILLFPILFKSIQLSKRLSYISATVLIAVFLHQFALPFMPKLFNLLNHNNTADTINQKFEITIDKNYDGSQLERYFGK